MERRTGWAACQSAQGLINSFTMHPPNRQSYYHGPGELITLSYSGMRLFRHKTALPTGGNNYCRWTDAKRNKKVEKIYQEITEIIQSLHEIWKPWNFVDGLVSYTYLVMWCKISSPKRLSTKSSQLCVSVFLELWHDSRSAARMTTITCAI